MLANAEVSWIVQVHFRGYIPKYIQIPKPSEFRTISYKHTASPWFIFNINNVQY